MFLGLSRAAEDGKMDEWKVRREQSRYPWVRDACWLTSRKSKLCYRSRVKTTKDKVVFVKVQHPNNGSVIWVKLDVGWSPFSALITGSVTSVFLSHSAFWCWPRIKHSFHCHCVFLQDGGSVLCKKGTRASLKPGFKGWDEGCPTSSQGVNVSILMAF